MAKPAKHNKAWSAQEIALLKEHYRKGILHRVIAKTLKRTLNAVESKIAELGFKSKRRNRLEQTGLPWEQRGDPRKLGQREGSRILEQREGSKKPGGGSRILEQREGSKKPGGRPKE